MHAGFPLVAMLGADEIAAGTVTIKHLAAQTQTTYPQSAAGAAIRRGIDAPWLKHSAS